MFKGIKLKTFLNTPREWHAFLIGFFEILCPWKPHQSISRRSRDQMKGEYHYYLAGRALGFVIFIIIIIFITKLAKEVLL